MPRTYQTGHARHKVVFETATQGVDSPGAITWSWSTLATRWASVRPLTGREYWGSMQSVGEQMYEFRVRYDSTVRSITSEERVRLSNYDSPETFRYFKIMGPIQIVQERHHVVIIMAKQVDGNAQII